MMAEPTEDWELWYPQAGATGLLFGRSRVAAGHAAVLVHAAPAVLTALVRGGDGAVLARGQDLPSTADTPIARLRRRGDTIERADIWPGQADLGLPVLLCGGEAGILASWWHADDRSEWRWQIELYNRRGG